MVEACFTIFREHRHFGEQIFLLAKNELIKTYKGAVIGPFWAVVKPIFTLFVYWFAFDVGLRSAGGVKVLVNGSVETYGRFIFMLVGFIHGSLCRIVYCRAPNVSGEQAVCDKRFRSQNLHDYDVYDHLEAVCPPAFVGADVYLYALCAWPEHL